MILAPTGAPLKEARGHGWQPTTAHDRQDKAMRGTGAGNERKASSGLEHPWPSMRKSPAVAHSTGTTISLARTMLSRERAADSMARGLLLSLSTSCSMAALLLRSCWTSALISSYCSEAARISARVRIVTVKQSPNVARMMIAKRVHGGNIPPRRRTSVRVPIISAGRSRTGESVGSARAATRCARSLSSVQ